VWSRCIAGRLARVHPGCRGEWQASHTAERKRPLARPSRRTGRSPNDRCAQDFKPGFGGSDPSRSLGIAEGAWLELKLKSARGLRLRAAALASSGLGGQGRLVVPSSDFGGKLNPKPAPGRCPAGPVARCCVPRRTGWGQPTPPPRARPGPLRASSAPLGSAGATPRQAQAHTEC
jgi:hypothetical protein